MNTDFGRIVASSHADRIIAERVRAPIVSAPPSKQSLRLHLYIALVATDCLTILAGICIGGSFRFGTPFAAESLNMATALIAVFLGIAFNSRAYVMEVLRYPKLGIYRAVIAYLSAVAAILLVAFYLKSSADFSRLAFGIGTTAGAILLIAGRLGFGVCAHRIVGVNPLSEVVITDGVTCDRAPGMFFLDAATAELRPDISDPMMLDRLGRYLKNADRVVVACPPERRRAWAMALKGASIGGEVLTPEFDDLGVIGTGHYEGQLTLTVSCGPLQMRERLMKRLLDVTVAILGLVLLSPVLLAVAIAIKLESPGPVLFVQKRLGQGNRLFRMIKFRSMRSDSCDAHGRQSTQRDDDRVTRVGQFIRGTSIDELPQLLNVLTGDMSIVGPRPHALGSTAEDMLFWEVDHRYWHRHASKPGLTGLAQVRGFRGATNNLADLTNRLQADLEYQAGWTIWRDIAIIISTFRVLTHRNAF